MSEELKQLEEKLWQASDKLRFDSDLKATQYSTPVLELIFLRFDSNKYNKFKDEIEAEYVAWLNTRNQKTVLFTSDWFEVSSKKSTFFIFVKVSLNATLPYSYDRTTFIDNSTLLYNRLLSKTA